MKRIWLIISVLFNLILTVLLVVLVLKFRPDLMEDLNKNGSADLIVFGDSQVNGGKWESALKQFKVQKSGHNGFTTSHLLWLIDEKVIQLQPQACLLEGGINDIGVGIPMERVFDNYNMMLSKLEKAKIRVMLQTVFYVNVSDSVNAEYQPRIDSLNNFLLRTSKEKKLVLIDINPLICENKLLKSEYTRDGVHLSKAGYEVWYEAVRGQLQKLK